MSMSGESEPVIATPEEHTAKSHFGLKDVGGWFIGLTAGNIIGDHLFPSELSDWSAAPRAAIAVSLMYGGSIIWHSLQD